MFNIFKEKNFRVKTLKRRDSWEDQAYFKSQWDFENEAIHLLNWILGGWIELKFWNTWTEDTQSGKESSAKSLELRGD